MTVQRISGKDGVIIDSNTFLELPKAQEKKTTSPERAGMFRYNTPLKAFEGVLEFDDGSLAYRRIPSLDDNGRLSTSTLPDSIVSGMRYMGTYSVITDDIDPPISDVVWNSLPAPTSANSGQYYICRGIMDSAIMHYAMNTPTTSPVVFIAENDSGQGDWVQIKYYFGVDPVHTTNKIVTHAFGRIIASAVPSTGHMGLISLSTDVELTAAFTSNTDPNKETAMSDGDWVISNGATQQRLRSTRTSIMAGQVSFDRTLSTAVMRIFKSNAGNMQTVTDNLVLNTIRRTGDSMYDDGFSPAAGRLALVNGTRTRPALCFTDPDSDIENDSGMDPSKWTDKGTGLYRPSFGSICFVSNTLDKLLIENNRVVLHQEAVNVTTNPALQFEHSTNTNNVGLTGINDSLSFIVKNKQQVKMQDGLSTFYGDLTVLDNTILGTLDDNDTLQVNATSTFDAPVTINQALVTTGSNFFDKDVRVKYNSGLTFVPNSSTMTGTVRLTSDGTGGLGIYLNNADYNVSVYEPGNIRRMYIGRYGIKLPVLAPVVDTVGEDGQIAFSTNLKSVVVKVDGHWTKVGAGLGMSTVNFVKANWVENVAAGAYTFTASVIDPLSVIIHEKNPDGSFTEVWVDTTTYTTNSITISIPNGTPDLRFDGRVIITSGS